MQDLNMIEVDAVSGGILGTGLTLLEISSAAGHLGRAFAFGFAIGTLLRQYEPEYSEYSGAGSLG